jgi:hypothetical protein
LAASTFAFNFNMRSYNEERVEQYMDNVLAFEYVVQSEGPSNPYNQSATGLPATVDQQHLTNDLDYKNNAALDLNSRASTLNPKP